MKIEVSNGEILDKLSVLELKLHFMEDEELFNLIKNHDHQREGNHVYRGRPQDQFYYDEFTRIPSKSNFDNIKCLHGKLNDKNMRLLHQYLDESL